MYAVFEKVFVELGYMLTFISAHNTKIDAIRYKELMEEEDKKVNTVSDGYFISKLFDGVTCTHVWKDDK